jgi:hypothetical protein
MATDCADNTPETPLESACMSTVHDSQSKKNFGAADVFAATAAASGVVAGVASAVTISVPLVSIPLVALAAGLGIAGVASELYAQSPASTEKPVPFKTQG